MSTREYIIQQARTGVNLRWWFISAIFFFIIVLNQTRSINEFWPSLILLGIGAIYNFTLSLLAHYKQIFRIGLYIEVMLDLVLISGIIHFTGGLVASPLFFLFPLLLIIQAFHWQASILLLSGIGIIFCGFSLALNEGLAVQDWQTLLDRALMILGMSAMGGLLVRVFQREKQQNENQLNVHSTIVAEMTRVNESLKNQIISSTQKLEEANVMLVKKNLAMMAFHEIYSTMSSTYNLRRLLNLVMDTAMSLLKANAGCILLWDETLDQLRVKVARGMDHKLIRSLQIKQGEGMEGLVWKTGKAQIIEDCSLHAECLTFSEDTQSKMCIPLNIKRKIVGVITVESSKINAFNRSDLELFNTLGSQASEVLQNIEMYQEMHDKAESLSLLFEVSQSIGSIFNLNRLFATILERAVLIMKARRGTLMIYDEANDFLVIRASLGIPAKETQNPIRVDRGIIANVFREARPILINSVENNNLFDPENDHAYMGRELIACPLAVRKKVFGVICLNDHYGSGKHFTRDDLNLLGTLASQAAIAIENVELYASIRRDYLNAIRALAAAVDAKDHYTHGHSNKVMAYASIIAKEMGLSEKEIEKIRYGALLHDVGKIGISEALLNKPSRLTPKEFDTIAMHPILGVSIVQNIESLKDLIPIILSHHERYSGGGYPEGRSGNSIPLGARIVAIADAWDVMTSDRAYRKALPLSVAVSELKKCASTQFDPELVEIFLRALEKNEQIGSYHEEEPTGLVWNEEEISRLMD